MSLCDTSDFIHPYVHNQHCTYIHGFNNIWFYGISIFILITSKCESYPNRSFSVKNCKSVIFQLVERKKEKEKESAQNH